MRVSEQRLYIAGRFNKIVGQKRYWLFLRFALPHIALELFVKSTALKFFRKLFKALLNIGPDAGFDLVELPG